MSNILPTHILSDGDTFISDNSRIEYWERCPRAYQYAAIRRIEPAQVSSALKFGEALHMALQCRFQLCGNRAVPPEVELRQLYLLEEFWKTWSTPIGDHRTLGMACQVVREYNRAWGADSTIDILEGGVEIPFAVPLGVIEVQGVFYKVVWIGRIDLVIQDSDQKINVVDHKSSKMGGEYALSGFQNSGQLKGYCYACSYKFGKPVSRAMVDLLVIRPPAKKQGKGNEYIRKTFTFEPEQIEEWRLDMLNRARLIILTAREGFFPMHTKNCIDKFGQCPYFTVCNMVPLARENSLRSGEFSISTWSPLHETSELYKRVMNLADNEIPHTSQHVVEAALSVGPSLQDLISLD